MIRLCHCELTGMVEILADTIGSCELCVSENTVEATQDKLVAALIFTKGQVETRNRDLKNRVQGLELSDG